MLEIALLIFLCRKLSTIAKAKGRSGGWGGLGAAFWIGGEFLGFIIGGVADLGMGSYLLALVFAGVGAAVSFAIVKSLKSAYSNPYGYADAPPMAPAGYAHYNPANPYSPPRG